MKSTGFLKWIGIYFVLAFLLGSRAIGQTGYTEQWRPLVHFSPKEHWMNDPNGMIYTNGVYHLFYQHHPYSNVWGPMHWGHASSKDLVHWKNHPIALFPDSLGYIFSGSAVLDKLNTSGFGSKTHPPLVAIFTSHDPKKENEQDALTRENQSIAYSLDNGFTWTKYANNPVVKNPGIPDFRDPKVMWYAPQHKWIMTLATKDRITFYSAPDLKNWKKESEFGLMVGAHGGVWECPDLFPLNEKGREKWVLLVNLNPGGPNKGSATQYFIGNFDGHTFKSDQKETKWVDYGPDEYAGITWSNTGARKIFIGWMSNWMYANQVPTQVWKNAATLPRDLHLEQVGKETLLASTPVPELGLLAGKKAILQRLHIKDSLNLHQQLNHFSLPCRITVTTESLADFSMVFANDQGEQLKLGYDKINNQYYIDRTQAGVADFNNDFAANQKAPRFSLNKFITLDILMDKSSVEVFADKGLTVMTTLFFPKKDFHSVAIHATDMHFKEFTYASLLNSWK